MDSTTTSEQPRDRGAQILSAKKKLKSYRAKQAQMSQKRSSLSSTHNRSGSKDHRSPSTPTVVLSALPNETISHPSTSASTTSDPVPPLHARTASRSTHGRGHSRTGSISISANSLLSQSVSTPSLSQRPTSMTPSSSLSHLRSHSRSHSRKPSSSRPISISLLGAKKEEPVVVAIEHPAGVNPLGEWSEAANEASQSANRRSNQFLDSSALFGGKSSTNRPVSMNKENIAPVTPSAFEFPSTPSAHSAPTTASGARHSRRLSRHARNTSISTKRESMEIMGGIGLGIAQPATSNSLASSRRRSSRMSNLPPASLLFGASESTADQDRKSVQDWDWKKAIAHDLGMQGEEEGRLTALEKLEGRAPRPASILFEAQSSGPRSAPSRTSKRLSGHARTESIQIPNLEEIHQNEINERRLSWKPSPNPDGPSSSASDPISSSNSSHRESWRSGLAPPLSSGLAGFSSPALPSAYLSSPGRPESVILHAESPLPEGLGTLMEEEEEEESLSPVRERESLDMPLVDSSPDNDERRKQRREAEEEIVKRNRRASLAPRPLKLKSRPPSLYLAPALRNGVVSSPTKPNFPLSPTRHTVSLADEATPKAPAVPLPLAPEHEGDQAETLTRSRTSPNLSSNTENAPHDSQDLNEGPPAATGPQSVEEEERQREAVQQEIIRAYRTSITAIPPPVDAAPASATSAPSQRQGMRTLRLGSQASLASIMEPVSSGSPSLGFKSAKADRRRSLIIGGSSSRDSDMSNAASSSSAAIRAARRSSIIYKTASSTNGESSAAAHSASDSITSLGGVPHAVHDELKAKAHRDAALLEMTKKQVERLEKELAHESERSARERADLEQWSAQKEQHLFERAERAEKLADGSSETIVALRAELAEAKEQLEDLQAEREVLQDDIDGWRSRCQDLEKTLRSEKVKADENRKIRSAARLRIKQLTVTLERAEVQVPQDDLGIYEALDQPHLDLTAILKSPALGCSSPVVASAPGFSPVLGSDVPSPQIAKLLADMRQQIFNLSGSLEHERKQHLQAQQELSRLQGRPMPSESEDDSKVIDDDASCSLDDSRCEDSREYGMSASSSSIRPSSQVLGKNKRHVFAYDSSMGSFGQSQSSNSLSLTTDETVNTDVESDMSDFVSKKLPASESETVGLGMGGLQTLDEIDEVSEVSDSFEGSNSTVNVVADEDTEANAAWIDIEAGPVRPSLDVSESSYSAHYEDAEMAPPTPDLYRAQEQFSSPLLEPRSASTTVPNAFEHAMTKSSASSSSTDSHRGPSTPPPGLTANDETNSASMRSPSPRPEFIREWSFELGRQRSARKGRLPAAEVEDFFGILREDRSPPLNTSKEALDLPPIIVQSNGTVLPTAKINKDGRPVHGAAASRIASLVGNRRPPVARSAYARESFDTTARPSSASAGVQTQARHDSNVSTTSSIAALGSRALSRMSLQHLTGAFSGLSGYLTNQSGAAVTAAAAATQMCQSSGKTPGAYPAMHPGLLESGEGSLSWTAQRRTLDEYDEEAGPVGGKYDRHPQALSWSSNSTSSESRSQTKQRRFVKKESIPAPKATPVWMLDFTRFSLQSSTGPVLTL